MSDSFPKRQARTRRFTLGAPRGFTISPDGARVVFLRSRSGLDPVNCLWSLNVATGAETLIADPRAVADPDEELPAEERARRERSREQAGGVVAYAVDRGAGTAAFALSGFAYQADLTLGAVRRLNTPAGVIDPRPDPTGSAVAYVCQGSLRVYHLATDEDRALAVPESPTVAYGLADFIAAEELHRHRGFWWSPDGDSILVARVDEEPVRRWFIADPANPDRPPAEQRYPAAGTPNARVELFVLGLDGSRTPVPFDDEYLADVSWTAHGLLLVTAPRDQRTLRILRADPATGETEQLHADTDPTWVEVPSGVPAHLDDGRLVWLADVEDGRRLMIDGVPVTPPSLQVREVCSVDGDTVLFRASTEPTEINLWTWSAGTLSMVSPQTAGVYQGWRAGGTTVISAQTLDTEGAAVRVLGGPVIPSYAERPGLDLRIELIQAGERRLRTAVLLPSWHSSGKLPVLLDPYAGPHVQRVLAAQGGFQTSQWLADQGFAVVVVDGRGTPGRGRAFDRAVHGDLAAPVLEDQIDALHDAAGRYPDLDLDRVAIRGWSFGGYLAALAVLRRPDVFHAAIAGAPVTDWELYDTAYTERYLGLPSEGRYAASSLLPDAEKLSRPLLLIHGLADDNVVAAHTLRLSSALLAAGRSHTVLPLSGVTHMTPQESVAENLLLFQVDFLRGAFGA
ncbi:S9 family peptidase [Rhizohabitans arisaemae]|uniref:S9 family peptidase n=1 Tax=Rhizohabitans arisaemae TaxID=2720610 RepID=UPI0024B278B8|nr:prolyl oligopeptidase family serine peptidase [Rhizohabitans arisaemae]